MHPSLSFDQAPPISVPYRFFLVAPWFGVLAGLLLAWSGADAFASRWTPEALALTHLIALGFMLQAMSGALFQFIPVAVGGNVWRPRLVANAVQALLVLATLLLVAGLLFGRPGLLVDRSSAVSAGGGRLGNCSCACAVAHTRDRHDLVGDAHGDRRPGGHRAARVRSWPSHWRVDWRYPLSN